MTNGFAEGDVGQRTSAVVILEFWTDHVPDAEGNLQSVDWVRWARVGSNGSTSEDKISRIRKHNPTVWQAIQRGYDLWKQGQDLPVDGTPLEAWSGLSKGQVAALKLLNIRSVEDLATVNDATMDKIGSGSRALREKALKFCEAQQSGVTAMAAKAAAAEATIRQLTERLNELEARLLAQPKQTTEPVAAKRGRPPKDRSASSLDDNQAEPE